MKIAWLTSEAAPYAKTGGLADVSASLPAALADQGHEVSVIMPYYPQAMGKHCARTRIRLSDFRVPFAWGTELAQIREERRGPRLTYYFIEFNRYFDRPFLYDHYGVEYGDQADRFIFFCRAAMEAVTALGLHPDILHSHDWHAALAQVYLKSHLYRDRPAFAGCRGVMTLHNLGYQGAFDKGCLFMTGLGWEYFNFTCLEYHDRLGLLKGGILCADMVTTVSPTYAQEILAPSFAFGLEPALRHVHGRGRLRGILNGIDINEWDPATDPELPAHYAVDDLGGKAVCKAALQRELGLAEEPKSTLIGIVSRLAHQKGIDVLIDIVENLMVYQKAQFAVLGSGESWLEARFSDLATRFPGRCGVYIGYHHRLAHLIEAGADLFAMPSRYEPCGLNQMYSMRYGTVPVARATGGLADTVVNYHPKKLAQGTGFLFRDLYPMALLNTLCWAIHVHREQPRHFARLQRNGMTRDFSWQHTAAEYEALYREARA